MRQFLVDVIWRTPTWLWRRLPRRVRLWAYLNDGL